MATIFEIKGDILNFYDFISDPESEYDEQVFKDTLEGLEGELEDKMEAYMRVIVQLESDAEGIKGQIDRLQKQYEACVNPAKRMRQTMLQVMRELNRLKVQTEHFKLAVQKNGGPLPLKITGKVPDVFMVLEPKPDTKRIREALEEGFELEWAHLEERGVHLSVR